MAQGTLLFPTWLTKINPLLMVKNAIGRQFSKFCRTFSIFPPINAPIHLFVIDTLVNQYVFFNVKYFL